VGQRNATIENVKVQLRKILRTIFGIILVLLGVTGLILPIMPGWIFLIPGLIILSDYFPGIKRLLQWAKEKSHIRDSKPR
jgi:uncharacterized membrane protein YbaN (DUF454 family)